MRAVLSEKSAAVCSELFDCNLRSDRSKRNQLLCAFNGRRGWISVQGLNDALLRQHDYNQDRQRQQEVERTACQIGPKISDAARLLAHQSARQCKIGRASCRERV